MGTITEQIILDIISLSEGLRVGIPAFLPSVVLHSLVTPKI